MLLQHQESRKAVSDDLVRQFMSVRPLQWNQIKPHPDYVPASAAEVESLKLEIEKQGGVVKGMKEAKAAKEEVTAAVQVLNALKEKVRCLFLSAFMRALSTQVAVQNRLFCSLLVCVQLRALTL